MLQPCFNCWHCLTSEHRQELPSAQGTRGSTASPNKEKSEAGVTDSTVSTALALHMANPGSLSTARSGPSVEPGKSCKYSQSDAKTTKQNKRQRKQKMLLGMCLKIYIVLQM